MIHPERWAGDFLLLFGEQISLPPARMRAAWIQEHKELNSCLYLSTPDRDWKGSPVDCWQEGPFQYWLLGSLWGEHSGFKPQDWSGHFVLLGLNTTRHEWHLWTDRCGTFHTYHAVSRMGTALGTYSPAVSYRSEKQLDLDALAGFFTFGFFPGDRTYFKDVKIIRPASHLVINGAGAVIQDERLHPWQHQPDESLSFNDAVDTFAAIFHQVIREQVSGRRVSIPISGGLDSRSTIAALPESSAPDSIWCYSYGYTSDSSETRIAGKIAAARRLPFEAFTIQPYLFEKLPIIMDSIEGFQDITQCRQAFLVDALAQHSSYVMAAHWGDVWLDSMGLTGSPARMDNQRFVDTAQKKFTKRGSGLAASLLFREIPPEDIKVRLSGMLEDELVPFNGIDDPDFRLKVLKTELWSFRWTTASLRMFQPGAFPLLPFYDPRLVDFFCRVPTKFVTGRRLQIEYLKRYAPDLARIPWQVYDANLYWYRYHDSLLLPKRIVKKIARQIFSKPVIQRNWEVQFLSAAGRKGLEDHLLSSGLKVQDMIPFEEIKSLVEGFYTDPSPENSFAVSMLLTFSTWLEKYD